VNTTLDELQSISVATQKEVNKTWFKDVLKNTETMVLKKDITRKILDLAFHEHIPKDVPLIMKSGSLLNLISLWLKDWILK